MNDYQNHFQNYSQTFDSTSAMQLAYLQATHGGAQLDDLSYGSGSWQHKSGYGEQSCGRVQGPAPSMGHHDSLLYASEFADPHSNLEIGGYDSSSPYSYLPSSGYPMTLEDIDPAAVHQDNETVAAASYLPHGPIYGTSPLSASSTRYHLDTPSDSLALSWPNNKSFQVSPVSGAPTARCSPVTVKSQRPGSQDFSGFDTPPSPFSLGHSKHSSSSPSPGPLTPAVGHATLQADLYPLEGRPSQGSSRNLYARNEDIDPDRPYPCSSCRMAFARQHDLTRHSRVHSGETPYHCHGCRQGFRRSDARSRHWGKDGACLALHQRLVEGTEEGRKLQKSLSRLGEKAGRVGTSTFRVKPQTRGIDN